MRALSLIIGNSKYEDDDLVTPQNDANDLSDKLKGLGFIVKKDTNVDLDRFNQLVDSFGNDLNKFDVGLFYFAGHGMQIDGDNFLAATNTNFESETSAKYSSITLYKIIDYMHKAKNETNIIILDACRNNPYEKKWSRGPKQNGLAPIYAPKGTLIAFSTSPGETASNGIGRNGLYTGVLLRQLDEKNIQIEELFKRIRNSVYSFSKGKQTTWEHTSLTGKFVFNSGLYMQVFDILYADNVVADKNYVSTGGITDEVIEGLKSYNWYTQGPAMKRLNQIDIQSETKDKLFLLGRNIMQTASGGEWAATEFMNNLPVKLNQFDANGENHVLNGILFEIYFNSEGKFRGKRLKKAFMDEVFMLQDNPNFEKSFNFIHDQLLPFAEDLLYIPSTNKESFSVDIVLEKDQHDNTIEYEVKEIKHEGIELLNKAEDSWFSGSNGEIYYEPYKFSKLKDKIASELGVPNQLLNINTNYPLEDNSKLLYPFGYEIKKNRYASM